MLDQYTRAPEGGARDAVWQDRYDQLDHEHAVANVEPLAEAEERIARVHDAAVDIGRDLFASFYKPAPRVREADEMKADRLINRAVVGATMETEAFRDVRQYTVGDRTTAALAVSTVVDTVTDLYRKVAPEFDEKVDAAAAAEAEVERLLEQLTALQDADEPDDEAVADAQADVTDAVAKAEAARAELDATMDGHEAAVGRAVRKAMAKAADHVEGEVAMFGGWGVERGEMQRMDPKARLALAARLKNPRLMRIAALFGRLRNLSFAKRAAQWNTLPEEVFEVTVGVTDPAWMLTSELMLLGDPDTEDEFYRRLAQGEVMGYNLRGREKSTQGAIILLKDGSGSMEGDRDIYASSIGLALLGVAHDEKRAFHGIQFGSRGHFTLHSFPSPAEFTTENMLAWAETCANRREGTCFETPLAEAVRLLDEEYAATGRVTGDIVMVTDGESRVSDAFMQYLADAKARLGFRVFGIAIGRSHMSTLTDICEGRVMSVQDIHSGRDIEEMFRELAA